MRVLDRINNVVGTFWGVGAAPTAGSKSVTVTADMPAAEVTDTSNYLRLAIWADFGYGPRFMARSAVWQGGPGKSAPSLTWQWNPVNPPQLVYGVLENGVNGQNSPAIAGLKAAFN